MKLNGIALAAGLVYLLLGSAGVLARDIHVPVEFATIAEALEVSEPGDRVMLADGVYHEFDLDLRDGVSLIGDPADASRVVIDALGQGRVIRAEGLVQTAFVAGMTITGGDAQGETYYARSGGGMFISDADVRLNRVNFVSNKAAASGGGLRISQASPVVTDCLFKENSATEGGGGLDCSYGGSPSFVECRFVDNEAAWGGGASVRSGAQPSFLDCEFLENVSVSPPGLGGALACDLESAPMINGCVITRNSAKYGGGIFVATGSTPRLTNTTLDSNQALLLGGGLYCNGTSPALDHTIITFHVREAVHCKNGASPTLLACDVFGNDGGDWTGPLADQLGEAGNISADPIFCEPQDLGLQETSPCSPENNRVGLIGAVGVECEDQTDVTGFDLSPVSEGVLISWSCDLPLANQRLEATTPEGYLRELPISHGEESVCTALHRDYPPGREVTYSLYGREPGSDWSLLASDVYVAPDERDVPAVMLVTLQARPNPCNPSTTVIFTLDRRRGVRLDVFDIAGHWVDHLYSGPLDAGEHGFDWDGRDADGRALPSGTYLLVLSGPDLRLTSKLLLVR